MIVCNAAQLGREPLTGIGPGPFSDMQFAALVEAYESQFTEEQRGAVLASGLYERVPEARASRRSPKRSQSAASPLSDPEPIEPEE